MATEQHKPGRLPVWDLPTRLFHWGLLSAVVFSVVAIEVFDDATLHLKSGRVVLGLLVFRLLWGFFGASTARFAQFVRGPRTVLAYVRGEPIAYQGHSPLGALSVLAMLASLVVQVLSGLASDDEIFTTGPLVKHLSGDWVDFANRIHNGNKWVLMALVVTHVLAIAWYAIAKKNNLVAPMITGSKPGSSAPGADQRGARRQPFWVSWLTIGFAALVAYGVFAWI